jgi:electron transfer flavoprotein alpha subunit
VSPAPRRSRYDTLVLKPATPVDDFDEWRGVWVIAEHREGKVRDVTLELLGAARPMADKINVDVTAVLLCDKVGSMADRLVAGGADHVLVVEHAQLATPLARPCADVLSQLIHERKPEVVLIGATHTGRDISSRIAVDVEAGMTADCTELDVEPDGRELLARRPAFGGKMLATIRCDRHRPQMATARPGIFTPIRSDEKRPGKIEHVTLDWLDHRAYAAKVLDHVVEQGVDITKADVLVAGGLGIGPDGWGRLEELAAALGGEVACTRPVADAGWQPRGRQVGQTGVSVRPKLYVAVGLSGAIQHIEGMKESGTVIAVNSDPNAPIFQYADIGIVADWRPTIDALVAEARARGLANATWKYPQKDTLDEDRTAAAKRAGKEAAAQGAATERAARADTSAPRRVAAEPRPVPQPGGAGSDATSRSTQPADAQAPGKDAAATAGAPAESATAPSAATPPTQTRPAADPATRPKTNGHANGGAATKIHAASAREDSASGKYSDDPRDRTAVAAWVKANVKEETKAWVLAADCIVCNGCEAACPTGAAVVTDMARVDRDVCIADGACFDACPTDAIRPGIEDPAASGGWPEGSRLAGQFGV